MPKSLKQQLADAKARIDELENELHKTSSETSKEIDMLIIDAGCIPAAGSIELKPIRKKTEKPFSDEVMNACKDLGIPTEPVCLSLIPDCPLTSHVLITLEDYRQAVCDQGYRESHEHDFKNLRAEYEAAVKAMKARIRNNR